MWNLWIFMDYVTKMNKFMFIGLDLSADGR